MVLSDTGHIPPGSCATASTLLSDSRGTLHSDGSERIDMDQYIQTRFLTGLIIACKSGYTQYEHFKVLFLITTAGILKSLSRLQWAW